MIRLQKDMETRSEVVSEWLHELDPRHTGYVSKQQFKELLQIISPDLIEQELVTVLRRYDLDGDGRVSSFPIANFCFSFTEWKIKYEDFYTAVAPTQ